MSVAREDRGPDDLAPTDVEPFTVLMPVYDGDKRRFVRRAFESATREQTLPPAQVVIVRDGPVRPKLQKLLEKLAATPGLDVDLLELPRNVGLAAALEVGLDHCDHEIVARVDADDVSLPHRFAVQVPLVVAGYDLVGSAIVEIEEDEAEWGRTRTPPTTPEEIAQYSRFHDPFNHPSVVYRRTAVRGAGGYETLDLMEDYLLFARMIAGGANVANVAEPLVLYRVGAGAYARRGGARLLRSELRLQRTLRDEGFTSRSQYVRNVVVRGGYRLVPEGLRKAAYRSIIVKDRAAGAAEPSEAARGL
ncbi:glycosyltransferase [Luteimicrobium sp. DT211]|uniref:glycosyltransferase n=1 Tax=Luteimicrobium sp. DT211 TaxID=3393412 RepID=UPI003CEC901F